MNNPNQNEPAVYKAVRAIGRLIPKLHPQPQGKIFIDHLDVIGTAFWLKDYKVLITCAHVVDRLIGAPIEITGLLVVGNRGKYMKAHFGMVDFDHDLAVLRLPPDTPEEIIAQENAEGLEIVDKYPDVGEKVSYAGFPLGTRLLNSTHAPTYSEGVVGAQLRDQKLKKQIQITGVVVGGFSGAPITLANESHKIIGVLSNSPSKEAGEANIFMGISWEHVKKIAELAHS